MANLPQELSAPLSVIDGLLMKQIGAGLTSPPTQWGERAHFIQALGLDNEENFAQIPCLNDIETVETVKPFTLVRYRGLVQDVFEPEIYVPFFEEYEASAGGGGAPRPAKRVVPSKYRDLVEATLGHELRECGMANRGACYCVPLPAEMPWARAASQEWGAQGRAAAAAIGGFSTPSAAPSSAAPKRRREEDVDMGGDEGDQAAAGPSAAATAAAAAMPPPPVPAVARPRRARAQAEEASRQQTSDEFGLNFPLPWEERRGHGSSTACIVKLYDEDMEAVRVCQIVEFLGVLCVDPEAAVLDAEPQFLLPDARRPSTALVPRLHAILMRPLPFYNPVLPFSSAWLTEARLAAAYQNRLGVPGMLAAARSAAMVQLTAALGGDALAAEYVLMLLLARIIGQAGDKHLGCWSLNLSRWPSHLEVDRFVAAAGELVPRAVRLEISGPSLGAQRWYPTKDIDADRLVSGQLQLAPGTLMVLDETRVAPGQVSQQGIQSLSAIRSLVQTQQLSCNFQVMTVEIPLELVTVVVSPGKPLVSDADVVLPLRFDAEAAAAAAAAAASLPAGALEAARMLLAFATRRPSQIRILPEVAQQFSQDFANIRQELPVPADLAHVWLSLARCYCLSLGEEELNMERWRALLALERARFARSPDESVPKGGA